MIREYLHTSGWAVFATPVEVLRRGPKQATVKLLHAMKRRGPRGTVLRVPVEALSVLPRPYAFVSKGGGRYVRQ